MSMNITIRCNNTTSFCLDFVILNTPEPLHLQCCASGHPARCGLKRWRLRNLTFTETYVLFGLVI